MSVELLLKRDGVIQYQVRLAALLDEQKYDEFVAEFTEDGSYRLIARGTVEERILAMHRDKRALVSSILDGTDVAARLTTKDLLALVTDLAASA